MQASTRLWLTGRQGRLRKRISSMCGELRERDKHDAVHQQFLPTDEQ